MFPGLPSHIDWYFLLLHFNQVLNWTVRKKNTSDFDKEDWQVMNQSNAPYLSISLFLPLISYHN